mgnify:CR=1 FL=1
MKQLILSTYCIRSKFDFAKTLKRLSFVEECIEKNCTIQHKVGYSREIVGGTKESIAHENEYLNCILAMWAIWLANKPWHDRSVYSLSLSLSFSLREHYFPASRFSLSSYLFRRVHTSHCYKTQRGMTLHNGGWLPFDKPLPFSS